MAEDIITALSRFPDLAVVARTSSFTYKGKAIDIRRVGQELGVGYVVEGSVRKDGDRLRIVSQLIETKNGEHVWAEEWGVFGGRCLDLRLFRARTKRGQASASFRGANLPVNIAERLYCMLGQSLTLCGEFLSRFQPSRWPPASTLARA